jgi:hypothetical protein
MPLSFSRLSTFEQCQAKFDYLYVSKSVKDEDNEYTIYGNRVHKALEEYGKKRLTPNAEAIDILSDTSKPVGPEVKKYAPLMDRILAMPGDKLFEFQMAINKDLTPCDWYAPDVWVRSIADVLIVNKDTAYCLDWKTGKIKGNPTQLKLFACMVFAHFTTVNTVKTAFVWLQHDDMTVDEYKRDKLDYLWGVLMPRFKVVQDTINLGVFKPSPSGLCRFCPARSLCPDTRYR